MSFSKFLSCFVFVHESIQHTNIRLLAPAAAAASPASAEVSGRCEQKERTKRSNKLIAYLKDASPYRAQESSLWTRYNSLNMEPATAVLHALLVRWISSTNSFDDLGAEFSRFSHHSSGSRKPVLPCEDGKHDKSYEQKHEKKAEHRAQDQPQDVAAGGHWTRDDREEARGLIISYSRSSDETHGDSGEFCSTCNIIMDYNIN